MSLTIRPANITDVEAIAGLLVLDAEQRYAANQTLWKMAPEPHAKVASTITAAMQNEAPPFRQHWLIAESEGNVVGVTHTILLPVPPIYAGEFGPPGLIMEDCYVLDRAPSGTAKALLEAAEADLVAAGAKVLLGSSIAGGIWGDEFLAQSYEPLTLYFSKTGLSNAADHDDVQKASEDDIPAIVASSAVNRQVLFDLNDFWKPHPEADARFGSWMTRSLTLTDRDMLISNSEGDPEGYSVSQPATPLHFPSAHDVVGTGFIDDYFHADFENPTRLENQGHAARALLQASESALEARGNDAALIVCPAAWISKIEVLQSEGYETEIVWFIKA
ncbi:hypothetical protein [Litoreibacter janthinus]|uniref:N-acetyltransferase domain-containing protein n=1 Tax=Litoreibacter janthinus TaxID=670154 RepID=A0A1I6HQE5_9RHOB|nr:hypothetical protein [Litoreibacter janthinus]SFR56480.1 hypothetical protein SAMN04488002_3246 [Litoreibacter janthinus]